MRGNRLLPLSAAKEIINGYAFESIRPIRIREMDPAHYCHDQAQPHFDACSISMRNSEWRKAYITELCAAWNACQNRLLPSAIKPLE